MKLLVNLKFHFAWFALHTGKTKERIMLSFRMKLIEYLHPESTNFKLKHC